MFAVIVDGSHQHQVREGDTLEIDYRAGSERGDSIQFEHVLLANGGAASVIGRPAIDGAVVEAEVVTPEVKDKKIEVATFRKRKNSRRHIGHRQKYTAVRITAINIPGLEVAETPAAGGDD
jgi:large subunit ribosomal protein L21